MDIFNSSKKKTSSSRKNSSTNHKTHSITKKKTSSTRKVSTPKSIPIKIESKSPQTIQEFELKFPKPLPDKITFNEKISKKMTALFNKHEDIKPFIGDTLFKDIFYLYLFNKYKTKCLVTQADENLILEMKIFIDSNESNINNESLEDLAKKLVSCISQNEPIIIIPLSLKIFIKGKSSGHANALIYRNNTRELEHFEPHGSRFEVINNEAKNRLINETLDKDLDYLVKNMNDELNEKGLLPIKLIKSHEVCPRLGVQKLETRSLLPKLPIEPGGYCVAWSMFFAEMCLKNPEIPSAQIYKAILDEREKQGGDVDYFKKIIRGYTCFINNKMAKYFTEILGSEATSAKLNDYHKQKKETSIQAPEMTNFLYKLNFLINEEANPNSPTDIKTNKMLKDTLKKYTTFKKTVRKSTSSSDLSLEKKESRRNMKQLQGDYNTKLLEFIDRRTAKDKEKKAAEKLRKAEEKQRKLEEKEQNATEKLASKTAKTKAKTTTKAKTQRLKMKTTSEEV